jgi:hypothetical protein
MSGVPENVCPQVPQRGAGQFTLPTLFWLMLIIGIALAYLRLFGMQACLLGLVVVGLGLAAGAAMGLVARRPADAVYWSLLGAFFAYVCTQGVSIPHWSAHLAWGAVGAAAGAGTGVLPAGRPLLRMLIGGLMGGLVVVPYCAGYFFWRGEWLPDLFVAPLAGALLGAVIEGCTWLEHRWPSPHARHVCAACLMLLVMAANLTASRYVPSW